MRLSIKNMRKAYKLLYKSGLTLEAALKQMKVLASETPEVELMVSFIETILT